MSKLLKKYLENGNCTKQDNNTINIYPRKIDNPMLLNKLISDLTKLGYEVTQITKTWLKAKKQNG